MYLLTFVTFGRQVLAPAARDVVLKCIVHDHLLTYWLQAAVVMPDHVHMLLAPYDGVLLSRLVSRIKGVSARWINIEAGRFGHVWQREYFDHILRSDEDIQRKAEYICQNPVRAGLVKCVDDYPWIWRQWVEGQR